MLSLVFQPAAEADVLDAHAWYAAYGAATAARFSAELAATVGRVVEHPRAFAKVHNETRRAVLHRFPYAVYYRIDLNMVVVLALHGRQDPSRWKART
ncbi:MAG: type II toxin-antitoxin system RelE/ParE family toxin [Vicinamibacterales bacterium]